MTDGKVATEGAQWDATSGRRCSSTRPAGSLTYDLGVVRSVSAFLLQADANDSYKVFGATENTPSSFKLLTEIDSVVNVGHGLRTRPVRIEPTAVRYIRIGEPLGDNSYSISEFQVYCAAPNPFPPKLPIVDAPPAKVIEAPWYEFKWFANDESARFEMGLALAACLLLIWGIMAGEAGAGAALRAGCATACWPFIGVVSFLCYFNFGHVALPEPHPPVGHVPLLRRLEVLQRAVVRPPVRVRRRRRLRGARAAPPRRAAQGDEPAHQHDGGDAADPRAPRGVQEPLLDRSAGRTSRSDVAHFRGKHDVKRWEEAQTDHGYNGTPVWNILGTTAVEHRARQRRTDRLADLDRSAVHRRA